MVSDILLFSGGLDSFIAYDILNKPQTLYFDTGSRYCEKELEAVRKIIPTTIINESLCLTDYEEVNAHIPYRNLLFAIQACKYSDNIWMGGLLDDNVGDKTEESFKAMSYLLSKLHGRNIQIRSPFWEMTKIDIVQLYKEKHPKTYEADLLQTVSCYSASPEGYCGQCASCFRKATALYSIGIKLAFTNRDLIDTYRIKATKHEYHTLRNKAILTYIKTL